MTNADFEHGSFPDNSFWQETSDVVRGICNALYRLPDPSYPINEGIHTVWSFCATIRAMDADQETVKCTPESFCEIWLDSHILEVCTAMRVNEWSRGLKTLFSTAAIDFKQGCQEQMTSCSSIWNDRWWSCMTAKSCWKQCRLLFISLIAF